MKKRLSQDAKEAILEEVRKETDRVLNYRFADLQKNIIDDLSKNVNKFLLENGELIVEKSKKDLKKQIRTSINCILEGYKDLKDFVKNANKNNYSNKVNYNVKKIMRTNRFVFYN